MTDKEFSEHIEHLLWANGETVATLDQSLSRIREMIEEHATMYRVLLTLTDDVLEGISWIDNDKLSQSLLWALYALFYFELPQKMDPD